MKKLLVILFCLPMIGLGQCISGDCENGTGKAKLSTGIYEGEFLNGVPNGKGKLELNNGNIYEGEFVNGRASGKGVLHYGHKNRYEGDFYNHEPNGKGVLYNADGSVYEGSFLDGKPSGEGFETLKNGEIYTGPFEEGKRQGWGRLNLAEGKFKAKYHKGILLKKESLLSKEVKKTKAFNEKRRRYPNGDIYTGDQVLFKRTGHGIMEYKNGDKYIGHWENDLQNGTGIMYYDNGDEYSGNWKKGKRQGVGRFLKKGRKKSAWQYNGGWYNDKMHGEGKILWNDSSLLIADFTEGMPTGRVEYQHVGEFKNNIDELRTSESYSYIGEIDLDLFREDWIIEPKGKGLLEYGGIKYGVDILYWHSIQKYGRTIKGPAFNTISLAQAKDHFQEESIPCEVPKAPPELVISNLQFYDVDSDSILDPGETGRVCFILKNEGKGAACNLIPKLSSDMFFNEISIDNTKTIKTLQAGEETYVEINILALETASNNEMQLEIDIIEGNGFDLYPKIPIIISTQELLLPDIRIVDSEFYSKTGGKAQGASSMYTLKYIVQNLGKGKAELVKVKFNLPDNIFPTGYLDVDIGKLKSGEERILDFEFFVNTRFTADKVNINLDIEEKNRKYAQDTTLTMEFKNELRSAKKVSFAVQQRKTDKSPIKIVSLGSLVDKNIPTNSQVNNRFALIIGNEDYTTHQTGLQKEQNVDFAENDARIFKEYALKTFGVKEKNMFYFTNVTSGVMGKEINRIIELVKLYGEDAELIIYYAGHGFPDKQNVPHLIPVDVAGGDDLSLAINLLELYQKLANTNASKITIFLDACFTGGGRNSGLLASRGVTIKPKEGILSGNLVVFSASSGEQSSLPFNKERHGIFTYHLLKKLQQTKGEISYSDLFNAIKTEVNATAIRNQGLNQTPEVNISQNVKDLWKDWKF